MANATTQLFGDFRENLPASEEYLTIGFSPGRRPLQKRWENNELSADFIADYYRSFHVDQQELKGAEADEIDIENVRDAVKYISNELFENSMKFQLHSMGVSAKIALSLYDEEIVFSISNGVSKQQSVVFQEYIQRFINNDPQDLYFEIMRASAREENVEQSGMGLLSMVCDYGATLGWRFALTEDDACVLVTTMVCLRV